MEYLLVIGFSLVILIPVTALLYEEYNNNKEDVYIEHLNELAREIAFQSERIYYLGAPSKTTIDAFFPPNLEYISIDKHTITFKLHNVNTIISQDVPILLQGSLQTFQGPHKITLQVNDAATPLDASDDYVLITDS